MSVRSWLLRLLSVYQKFFTLLGYGSCRYYPTCSEYARWHLEADPWLLHGIWHAFLRILRCNHLFAGGIDYPVCSRSSIREACCAGKIVSVRYWLIPDGNQTRIIKNFTKKV